jgi:hypothetical protein
MAYQGKNDRRCDGVLRRDLLRVGALSAFGLTLSDWGSMRAKAAPAKSGKAKGAKTPPACILIWLDGGPSHLETFDLKPDAPSEVRGPFKPIKTNVPGMHISEYLPRTAKHMDKVALIRSMNSTLGEHNFASHYLLTGYKPSPVLQYPGFGSVITQMRAGKQLLPSNVAVRKPNAMATAGYLPGSAQPFVIQGDPSKPNFRVSDLNAYRDVTDARLERRRSFREALDGFDQSVERAGKQVSDPAFEQAYRLILSPKAKSAFDLSKEPAALRQKYGRHTLGQSCLMARRLIEAGAQFVTVTDRGWDTHDRLFNRLKEGYTGGTAGKIPKLDTAYAALLEDLSQRGMLDNTLVMLMGEFGRTPKLNTRGGRDHWPGVFSVALAGGGIQGGKIIGRSDPRGEGPADNPVSPADLARSVYTLLGVDPNHEFHTADGRPVQVNRDGKLIEQLLA